MGLLPKASPVREGDFAAARIVWGKKKPPGSHVYYDIHWGWLLGAPKCPEKKYAKCMSSGTPKPRDKGGLRLIRQQPSPPENRLARLARSTKAARLPVLKSRYGEYFFFIGLPQQLGKKCPECRQPWIWPQDPRCLRHPDFPRPTLPIPLKPGIYLRRFWYRRIVDVYIGKPHGSPVPLPCKLILRAAG